MKKSIFWLSVLCVALLAVAPLFSDDFKLQNVPSEYFGTYMPVQYENILKNTREHYAALNGHTCDHDILLLSKDRLSSDVGFSDSYAITVDEFKNFGFFTNDNGTFLIDEHGGTYRRVSTECDYKAFDNRVLEIIFADAQQLKNVSLNTANGTVVIDGTEYTPHLERNWVEQEDVSLWLAGKNGWFALKLDGISATLYKSEREGKEKFIGVGDVYKTFPLFYWGSIDYPELKLWQVRPAKKQLRLLRNLIFAKHGYSFKDKELQTLYAGFEWYKKNPSFSENLFSAKEKNLLEDIMRREKE